MRAAISVWLSSLSRRTRTSSSISSRRRSPAPSRPGNRLRRIGGIPTTVYLIRYRREVSRAQPPAVKRAKPPRLPLGGGVDGALDAGQPLAGPPPPAGDDPRRDRAGGLPRCPGAQVEPDRRGHPRDPPLGHPRLGQPDQPLLVRAPRAHRADV